jgi:hypothetical protein
LVRLSAAVECGDPSAGGRSATYPHIDRRAAMMLLAVAVVGGYLALVIIGLWLIAVITSRSTTQR